MLAVSVFYFSQDALAHYVWNKFQLAGFAIFLDRGDAGLAMNIGEYYFGGQAYDLSVANKSFRKAIAIDEKTPLSHYQLGRVLFVQGKFREAEREMDLEKKYYPENFRVWYMLGLIRGFAGDLNAAAENFQRFIEWAPSEWAGYNDLAWIEEKSFKFNEAKGTINKAFAIVPQSRENPWLWNALGVAELNLGDLKSAKRSFENAARASEKITIEDWKKTYPGNNPADAPNGILSFRKAIKENLKKTEE